MTRQFDVPIGDFTDLNLRNADAIDQMAHRHEHARRGAFAVALDENGVVGRQQQVARRNSRSEGAGAHADRPHLLGPLVARAVDAAVAEPRDGRRAGRRG